jgi:glycine cleavage system H protein
LNVPEELQYTRSHEWVRTEDDTAIIGITDYAQEELGDIVYIELPEHGDNFDAGDSFGTVESVKAVSDSPEKINEDPYGGGWIVKLRVSDEGTELLSASDYEQLLEEEES